MPKTVYLKKVVIGLILIILLLIATIYIWSELLLNKKYNVGLQKLAIPNDTASIQEGARLVRIAHCLQCHGETGSGRIVETIDHEVLLVAPNITTINTIYSVEELERLIRHGVKKDGTSAYFMPSNMYYEMKDEAIAKIIAYLKTLKQVSSPSDLPSSIIFYPFGRIGLINGKFKPRAAMINHSAPKQYVNYDTSQIAFGRYLTITACSNCHGKDLKGDPINKRPSLVIASAYTKEKFQHFIKTGEGGLGRKDLGLMSRLAKYHFSYLNDSEINAMYAFLRTLPYRKD